MQQTTFHFKVTYKEIRSLYETKVQRYVFYGCEIGCYDNRIKEKGVIALLSKHLYRKWNLWLNQVQDIKFQSFVNFVAYQPD